QEDDERRPAAARQHAVVDLEHEHGTGEHQDVAHSGEKTDGDERAAAGGERLRKLRGTLGLRGPNGRLRQRYLVPPAGPAGGHRGPRAWGLSYQRFIRKSLSEMA